MLSSENFLPITTFENMLKKFVCKVCNDLGGQQIPSWITHHYPQSGEKQQ